MSHGVCNLQTLRFRATAFDLHRHELGRPFRISNDPLREFPCDIDDSVTKRCVSRMILRIDIGISAPRQLR